MHICSLSQLAQIRTIATFNELLTIQLRFNFQTPTMNAWTITTFILLLTYGTLAGKIKLKHVYEVLMDQNVNIEALANETNDLVLKNGQDIEEHDGQLKTEISLLGQTMNIMMNYLLCALQHGDFFTVNGKCFYAYTGKKTYQDALRTCQSLFGRDSQVAVPTSEEENSGIKDGWNNGANFWIGITDIATEGEWVDEAGNPAPYFNWAPNQPDNWQNAEHCATSYSAGDWNDDPCTSKHGFVCQY